ncbi:MAG: dihydrolipoamide acetyltransferase family protein [Solirubrobacteraceae bacterium]
MTEIVMPRLSDSMEEGTILKWLKSDGESVSRGEPLAEIETDKATLTYESDAAGVLAIVVAAGETLAIGEVIARLDEGDGDGAAQTADASEAAEAGASQAAETGASEAAETGASEAAETGASEAAETGAQRPAETTEPSEAGDRRGRVKASPLARRIAHEESVDLHRLSGTGPGGRVVRSDVEQAASSGTAPISDSEQAGEPDAVPTTAVEAPATDAPASAPPAPAPSETGTAKGDITLVELTRVQQVIARRMAESKATVPEFTLSTEIDMEGCVRLRSELKELGGDEPVASYNDMVVRACALALREFPRANASYRDAKFELHSRVNVGIAVAAPDALVVPTIFDADRKSLREIARDSRGLAERVREGTVTPPELGGGTFTVSNLGMFGVTNFTAVINPPQAGILAVGALTARAIVHEGELVARNTMGVTLACDHRILYGADAAQFLARIRELLEQPLALAF